MSIGNAVWLFLALPQWYFSALLSPFSGGLLSIIPASGVVALVIGLFLAFDDGDTALWWNLVPASLAHGYVVIAGLFRGQVDSGWPFWPFIIVTVAAIIFAIIRGRQTPLPALLIGWFSFTYALFAAFIGAMSFSNTWL